MKKFLFVPSACAFVPGVAMDIMGFVGSVRFDTPALPVLLTVGGALGMILSGALTKKPTPLKAANYNGCTEWTHVGDTRHGLPINERGFRG